MNAVDRIKDLPVFKTFFWYRHKKAFASFSSSAHLFSGIYHADEEARLAAPSHKYHGYDNEESADLYWERTKTIYPCDYPVLFWMNRFIFDIKQVFEIGGHVGIAYYAYQKHLENIKNLQWTNLDVPAVCERGEQIAKEKQAKISFTRHIPTKMEADFLLASGSLQYKKMALANIIAKLKTMPKHVIINQTPVNKQEYYTVQNIGPSYHVYKIQDEKGLCRSMASLGYSLVDDWQNPEKSYQIPFARQEFRYPIYKGFYWRLC